MKCRIRVVDPPPIPGLRLFLQLKGPKKSIEYVSSPDMTWDVEWEMVAGKAKGPAIYRHGDGRDFIYLSWQVEQGGMAPQVGRIKLYLSQITSEEVTLKGTSPRGGPACSTALVMA